MTTTASLTHSLYLTLTMAAGTDFAWGGRFARLTSDARVGLMSYLFTFSGGRCAFCGDPLTADWEVCHLVSGGPNRRGWIPGNLGSGCLECNDIDQQTGAIVEWNSILHPELIPAEWPGMAELKRIGKQIKKEKEERIANKKERRGI